MPREQYQRLWERYRAESNSSQPQRLDLMVAQRARQDGYSQKDIALILVAGSDYVRLLEQRDGRERARLYVNYIARTVCKQAVRTRDNELDISSSQELSL